jgi:hypothetical protein
VIRQNIRLGGKVAHLLQTRGRGGLKKGLRVRYTLQNHIPSDLLPPTRPYLSNFPQVPKISPLSGEQIFNIYVCGRTFHI